MANKNNDVCVGELGVTSCCLRWVVVDVKCEVCVEENGSTFGYLTLDQNAPSGFGLS